MDKIQKVILTLLISVSSIAWLFSLYQPDMMNAMMTLNPFAVSIFTASWTIGMVGMMFPSIVPMVLLYNRLIIGNISNAHLPNSRQANPGSLGPEEKQFKPTMLPLTIYSLKSTLFVASYILVWSLVGVLLLVSWSTVLSNVLTEHNAKDLDVIYGILLVISGLYQFSPLKRKCLGYCESPLAFFTKRWRGKTATGALQMGLYHGLYCLGCCWPYFLVMVALGWMNVLWMGLFAGIIFAEKIWSKGIWIARISGTAFVLAGALIMTGTTSIDKEAGIPTTSENNMGDMIMDSNTSKYETSGRKMDIMMMDKMAYDRGAIDRVIYY
jgi:predicted metal-binding membrane protein